MGVNFSLQAYVRSYKVRVDKGLEGCFFFLSSVELENVKITLLVRLKNREDNLNSTLLGSCF